MRTVIAGFIAGSVSVLIFHQFGFFIANELGLLKVPLYSLRPVPPLGVPVILSSAFWGGLWGIAAAFVVPRLVAWLDGRVDEAADEKRPLEEILEAVVLRMDAGGEVLDVSRQARRISCPPRR